MMWYCVMLLLALVFATMQQVNIYQLSVFVYVNIMTI